MKWKALIFALTLLGAAEVSADSLPGPQSASTVIGADIRVVPEKLVLGQETEAEIEIALPDSFEQRDSCSRIEVRVNTGEVKSVSKIEPGVFRAAYRLPDEFYPQFMLISVFADCGGRQLVGAYAHPLFGSGEVTVQSTPFTKVSLEIAGESFGPALTDGSGRAQIPVVVRPGISTGTAGGKTIDLNLPALKRIVAFAVPSMVAVDSEAGASIWVYAVTPDGKPSTAPTLTFQTQRGRVSTPQAFGPGIFRAKYTPPAQIGGGKDRIVAGLEGDAASTETLNVEILSGEEAQISVKVVPNRRVAFSSDPIEVVAKVMDKEGNAALASLEAASDFGVLTPGKSDIAGEYKWNWMLPDDFQGRTDAEVSVFSKTDPQHLRSTAKIELVAGDAAAITVKTPEKPISSDGWTAVPIQIYVVDRAGNPVRKLHLKVASDMGTLTSLVENESEGYAVQFTPPLRRRSAVANLAVGVEAIRAEKPVALTPRRYRLALVPEVGYFTNLGNVHAPIFSVLLDVSLWRIVPGLYAGVDVQYYFSKAHDHEISSTLHAFPLAAVVGYHFDPIARLLVDFGAGIGPFVVRHILSVEDAYTEKSSAAELGIFASAGASLRVRPGYVTFRLQYVYAKSKKIASLSGMLGGLALLVGYRFEPF